MSEGGSLRRVGVVAGLGLLLMAVLAAVGNFVVLERLVTPEDVARTAADVAASEGVFRLGVAALIAVVVLDVVVAWALWRFFEPVDHSASAFAAWFRLAYSAVFLVAIGHLAAVPRLVGEPVALMREIQTFQDLWSAGLVLFGVHLLLVGHLAHRSTYVATWVAALVALAGMGYLVDGFGTVLVRDYAADVAVVTGLGEVALIVWLLATRNRAGAPAPAAR